MIIGNRYDVKRNGKETSYSKTYICNDIVTNTTVFVKILKVQENRKDIVNELFKREVKALELLNHPHIIEYVDTGTDDDNQPYIVIEYFRSQNLFDFLQQQSIEDEQKFDIAIQILEALNYSHKTGIIHRDIKPQNILINEDYEIKIVDFGISKIIGMAYNPSETLKDYMSITYAAPEQLQRLDVNSQSDLYSFGMLLAFLFTEIEPPTSKKDLNNYFGTIEYPGLISIIRELTNPDLELRPRSGHIVLASLLNERAKYISNTQKINARCSPNALRKLRNMGMLSSADIREARSFISSDIVSDNYYGYKKKDTYYFIGEKIKYNCKLSLDRDYFNIVDVNIIDNQLSYESEIHKGTKLYVPWFFVDGKSLCTNNLEDTEKMADYLTDFEAIETQAKKEKSLENELINNWKKLLDEEYIVLNSKKSICEYTDLNLDRSGDHILITIRSCKYSITINDYLQLDLKQNGKKTVGQFVKLIDENTILSSLNPDVTIDDFNFCGTVGIDIVQEKTNLKRFSIALNQVEKHETVNPKVFDIINNPSIVEMNPITPINQFYQDVFKDQSTPNAIAVKKALATKDIFLLQGPPGTGKTTVIAEIICQILHNNENAKILLTSQSHVAVDHAIQKVSELLPNTCIVRIGKSDRISKSSEKLLYANKLDEWVCNTKQKSTEGLISYIEEKYSEISESELTDYLSKYSLASGPDENMTEQINKKYSDPALSKILNLVSRWQRHLGKLDEFDEIFADNASIVAATCVGIASRNKLCNIIYDWVIIDEAAKATPLETLIPLVKGKKTIMVGDHKQLPPIFKTDVTISESGLKKSDLEKSLFENLFESISAKAKLILTEQFRMHPAISQMISEAFYPEEKLTTSLRPQDRKHYLKWKDKAIIWLDTSKLTNNKETEVAFSKRNIVETKLIANLLEEIKNIYKGLSKTTTIGVISGYDAQKNLLYDAIDPNNIKWSPLKISIDNVDAFQGSEVDIVLYSVVRSNDMGQLGFLSDIRRLNVALSRGKNCLIIVGNYKFIQNANLDGFNPFLPILRYIENETQYTKREVITDGQ